jgi:hypothetical protein
MPKQNVNKKRQNAKPQRRRKLLNLRSESINNSRVNEADVIGSFCGQRIVTIDALGAEADDEADMYLRLLTSSHTSIDAEILPGEEHCADGIIRRTTTTEAVGYDTYHNQDQIETGQKRVNIVEARQASKGGLMVYYRPSRATVEVYTVGTELPCLKSEPEPYALIQEETE